MDSEQILLYVFSLILGILLANMLKGVCRCKVVEGQVVCGDDMLELCNDLFGRGNPNYIGNCICPS